MSPDRSSTTDSSATGLPQSFGRFRIHRLLGQGGMGMVYLADDPKKDRRVALKVLAKDKANNETLLKRFRSEALATRELKHENIVGVFEAGSIDGQFYIALEYVDGTDVARLIQSRDRLPVRRSLDITRQVALALSVAHRRNIVHRDIKPSNLLIRADGVVKLTDMGLARSLDDPGEASLTRAGTTVGTVDYISPEQARDSKSADVRSDIYSLGCTWYHMLTGQALFPDGSLTQKLRQHASTPAPDPRRIADNIPEGVVAVLQRMLDKSPDQRFQDPDDLLAALTAIALDRPELSADVIAALADDDPVADDHPDAPPGSNDSVVALPPRRQRRQTSETMPPAGSSTPPRPFASDPPAASTGNVPPPSPRSRRGARQIPEDSDDRNAGGVKWNTFRPVAIMLLSVSFLALLGYIFVNLGQSIDLSGTANGGKPFDSAIGGRAKGQTGFGSTPTGIVYDTLPSPPLAGDSAVPPPYLPSLRQGEKRHIFGWATTPRPDPTPVLSVSGRPDGRLGQFHSLDAAISALTDAGGWIQLRGPGPFFLTSTTLVDCGHVRISTPNDARAVVVLLPDAESTSAGLQLHNTHLELERVDLALSESGFPSQKRLVLFSVDSSDFRLVDCSVTQHRDREGGTVAISISGSVDGRACRVVFDTVLSRGLNTTTLEIDSRTADVAVINSLLISDTASPLRILTPQTSTPGTDGRRIRLFSCTLCSQAPLLTFDSGAMKDDIPSTQMTLVNTLMASPTDGERVLLDLGHWPQRTDTKSGKTRFSELDWDQHASLAFGVRRFIRRATDSGPSVDSYSAWQSCWSRPGENAAFVSTPWRPLKVSAHTVTPAYFDTRRFGSELQIGTDGNAPGCQVLALHQAHSSILARATGLAHRPRWPHPRPAQRPVLSLNLSDHPDLGRFLADNPPPPNAVIIVEGSGRTVTSPIVVGTAGIRILFKDSNRDQPLVLVPESPDAVANSVTTPNNSSPTASMFSVNGGTLELVGGRFQLQEPGGPAWFLRVTDGHFVIRDCSLLGPRGSASTLGGLIDVNGSTTIGSGRILGSFLAGGGSLIRTQCQHRSLLVTDSLLFSTGKVFDLDLSTSRRSCLDIRRSTLSGGESVFNLRATEPGISDANPTDRRPLDLFIDETVFAAGISSTHDGEPQAAIISIRKQVLDAGLLRWWGAHNGFTPLRRQYLVDPGRPTPSERWGTARHFASLFPSPHRIRPLDGPRAIPLATPLPKATQLRPTHFRIAATSLGLKWAPGGRPIGADLDKLDAQLGTVGPPPNSQPGERPDF